MGGGPRGDAAWLVIGSGMGERLGRGGVCRGDRVGSVGGEDRAGTGEPRVGGGGNGAAAGRLNAGGGGGKVLAAGGLLFALILGGGGAGAGVPLYGSQFVFAKGTLGIAIRR